MLAISTHSYAQKNILTRSRTAARKPAFSSDTAQEEAEITSLIKKPFSQLENKLDYQLEHFPENETTIGNTMHALAIKYFNDGKTGDLCVLFAKVYDGISPEGELGKKIVRLIGEQDKRIQKLPYKQRDVINAQVAKSSYAGAYADILHNYHERLIPKTVFADELEQSAAKSDRDLYYRNILDD